MFWSKSIEYVLNNTFCIVSNKKPQIKNKQTPFFDRQITKSQSVSIGACVRADLHGVYTIRVTRYLLCLHYLDERVKVSSIYIF